MATVLWRLRLFEDYEVPESLLFTVCIDQNLALDKIMIWKLKVLLKKVASNGYCKSLGL